MVQDALGELGSLHFRVFPGDADTAPPEACQAGLSQEEVVSTLAQLCLVACDPRHTLLSRPTCLATLRDAAEKPHPGGCRPSQGIIQPPDGRLQGTEVYLAAKHQSTCFKHSALIRLHNTAVTVGGWSY